MISALPGLQRSYTEKPYVEKEKKTGKVEVQICIFEVNDEGKANTICPVLWCIDKGRKCLALPKEDDLFEVPVQKMDS